MFLHLFFAENYVFLLEYRKYITRQYNITVRNTFMIVVKVILKKKYSFTLNLTFVIIFLKTRHLTRLLKLIYILKINFNLANLGIFEKTNIVSGQSTIIGRI